ncbi:MAG: trans-aconitate 2-methyltransferase [Rhizobiales bacterium]|nr:trans-aconitate 2-methyltransferase [Hyphomicrobiales bacterium]
MAAWSAGQYVKFEDERSRPSVELVARVPVADPRRVVDIGCGPGNSTGILRARWPEAELFGLDSSPDMLAAARKRLPGVTFIEADVSAWEPMAGVDVFFSNATLQWVNGHQAVMQRLMRALPKGGVLAVQVPDNQSEPTHALMRDVAAGGPWRDKFATPIARQVMDAPSAYYDLLRPFGPVDIWHTIYYHPLADAAAIVEWLKGSGLRPFLDRLDDAGRKAFLAEYQARIAAAYPPQVDGRVLLRFPRLFMVAVRG